MLPRASYLLRRPSHLTRAMASAAYIVPIDPQAPSSQAVPNLDPARLWSAVPQGEKPAKVGTTRIFYGALAGKDVAALSSLGEGFAAKKGNTRRELVRKAVGSAVKSVKDLGDGMKDVAVDASADPHAAGKLTAARTRVRSAAADGILRKLSRLTWPCTSLRRRPLRPPRSTPISRSPFLRSSTSSRCLA